MTINTHEIERIRHLPLFAGVSPLVLNEILLEGVVRVRERGTEVFHEEDPADRFFIVLSGWVRLYRVSPGGQVTTLEIFGPGESFAEGAMHMKKGFPASAEMIATGRLLEIPAQPFLNRLRRDPDLALNMLSAMAIRLKNFTNRLERMGTLSTPQRVGLFLLRFVAPDEPGIEPNGATVSLPYDKQLIAGRLDMTPETLSRSFRRLRDVGVTVASNQVRIADVKTLRNFVKPAS